MLSTILHETHKISTTDPENLWENFEKLENSLYIEQIKKVYILQLIQT